MTVTQGSVIAESVDVIAGGEDWLVLEVNWRSKYPELCLLGGREIMYFAGERTLRGNRGAPPTTITLPEYTEGWDVLAEHYGRYSTRILTWQPRYEDRIEVWANRNDDDAPE